MYKSILVPFDNSEHARNALTQAIELAKVCDAKVCVLSIVDALDFNDPGFMVAARMAGVTQFDSDVVSEAQREFQTTQEEHLTESTADIVGDFANVAYVVSAGKPQATIVDYADSGDYDLVVMGCRGLGAFRGAVGSVSRTVVHYVSIPVLLVK